MSVYCRHRSNLPHINTYFEIDKKLRACDFFAISNGYFQPFLRNNGMYLGLSISHPAHDITKDFISMSQQKFLNLIVFLITPIIKTHSLFCIPLSPRRI